MTAHDTPRTDERAGLSEVDRLVAEGDMRIEVVKREVNQGALVGFQSRITDYAAALIIVALDSFDRRDARATAAARRSAEVHRIVAAGPAYVMCACDMQRRDVPAYNAHLRAALADVPTSAPTGAEEEVK